MRALAAASALLLLLLPLGCNKAKSKDPAGGSGSSGSGLAGAGSGSAGAAPAPSEKDIDSKEIMARAKTAPEVHVHHVLLAWRDLEPFYASQVGSMDPRAKMRDNEATAKLAQELLAKLKADPDAIGVLIEQHSEDPGSKSGSPYGVTSTSGFAQPFLQLALRLEEREAGIVKTVFGYHVMIRVPTPVPDPLESADILKREVESPPVYVQHILIGWDKLAENLDPRAKARTKEAADKLAKELLAKVRAKGNMAKLMKEHSEDPGSKDDARVYEVDRRMVESFRNLSVRLKIDEVGLVKSPFGWHVIKRVVKPPPPPPDKLDSADILKRTPDTQRAKVKHILVGWTAVNAGDPRGKKRTRAELDKLVPEILERAKKGESFESLMIAYSEDDPTAVKAGEAYPVTPDAGLVEPFKQLSLRLKVNELGVVLSEFGIHIIKRVE